MINTSRENFRNLKSWERKQNKIERASKKSETLKRTLEKAKGGMVGELKRTIKDKDLKKDHYGEFKKHNNIK